MPRGELSNENKTKKYVERKGKQDRYAKLNRGKWRRFIYIKINCKGKRTVGKAKKGISVEKYNRFKQIKN